MTELGSGRSALKKMTALLEKADYHECACFINRIKGRTLRAIANDLPATMLNESLPASRCVVEGLYLKMAVFDLPIDCLHPEVTTLKLVDWITAGLNEDDNMENADPYMAQIRNILRVISVRKPELRDALLTRLKLLKRCLHILVSSHTVDTNTTDSQRLTLPEALKLEVRKHIGHLKQTLEKLELCTADKHHLPKTTDSTNSQMHTVSRNDIQDRLFGNKSLLNAFEPIQNYSQLTCLLQVLQCQIQSDKELLLTFTELSKQMQNIPMDCSLESVFQRYIQGYSHVLGIMLETAPSARNWVSMNDINQQTGRFGNPPTFSSTWHISVNSDALSESTEGGETSTEKASEATENSREPTPPMGCTLGHELPDEFDLPLPRSRSVSMATNGIAVERTTVDQCRPLSLHIPAPSGVDEGELVKLRREVHVLKKELSRCRGQIAKLTAHEKELKDRLSQQAQKHFLKGPTKFEDISIGAIRPTELIQSFGNLYTEARLEAFDALEELPQMAGFDDLKGKLLFSVVVLSFRSVQQEIIVIKKKIRDLLHMPDSLDDSTDSDDSLGGVATELETMMSDYFRRTVHKQDIQKNIEEVSHQMCQTLYDYPGLKDCDGLKLYIEEVVRLAWALSVQNPPLFIVYDFKTFNPNEQTRFHSSDSESDEVKAVLWPALQEGVEGCSVHKAVVIT